MDDGASISSYETGHETFEDALSSQPSTNGVTVGNGLMGFKPSPPPKQGSDDLKGTDLSTSNETDSTTQPRRRKSVRMALPPSVSSTPAVTPAALEDEDKFGAGVTLNNTRTNGTSVPNGGWQAQQQMGSWADEDSDAEGDYGVARRALVKATEHLAKAGRKKHAQA